MEPFGPGDDEPGDDPFSGVPVFGDLSRMFAQQGMPDAWQAARQFALMVATDGRDEPNVDPLERIRIEQLARVAELHVASTTGLVVPAGAAGVVEPVTRAVWAQRTLEAHRRYIEVLGDSLGQPAPEPDEPDPSDPMGFMAPLMRMAAPMMLGLSAGSMVGHLARRSFGQYDLPLPRPVGQGVLVVPANIDEFVEAWDLPADDLRLWVCLHELTFHTVLAVPHVRRRLDELLLAYLAGFDPAAGDLGSRLEDLDPSSLTGPGGLPAAFADPEVLLGAIRSPAQEAMLPELEALVSVLVGYVDHVLDRAGQAILPNHAMLAEAVRRRRVEGGDAGRLVERLFGLEITVAQVERGRAFVAGVIERAGEDGLARLWSGDDALPTPPEVEAPGLWLARIDLPS